MGETVFFYFILGATAEVFHVSSDLHLCNILLPDQLYSFFKEPFDSKMIKIYYWRKNISRENRSIKRFELTHKMINFKIENGLALVPLVTAIKWKDHIA